MYNMFKNNLAAVRFAGLITLRRRFISYAIDGAVCRENFASIRHFSLNHVFRSTYAVYLYSEYINSTKFMFYKVIRRRFRFL